jgi:hypothetical protein
VAHRALSIALVEGSWLFIAQALVHDLTEHRSTRLVEVLREVIHFFPRRGVEAGIDADAGAQLGGLAMGRLVHRRPFMSVLM